MAFSTQARATEYYKARAAKKKAALDVLRSGPCTDCKKSYPPYVMEFDHVPERGVKRFNIACGGNYSLKSKIFLDELAKCDLVCANCHRTRTHLRGVGVSG